MKLTLNIFLTIVHASFMTSFFTAKIVHNDIYYLIPTILFGILLFFQLKDTVEVFQKQQAITTMKVAIDLLYGDKKDE